MEKKSMKGYLYLMPALIVILLFTIYPLIRAFIMSFMEDYNMINGTYASVGFSNYVSIFKDKYFIKALTNTGIYVAFVVPCSIRDFSRHFTFCHMLQVLLQLVLFGDGYLTSIMVC